MKIENEICSLEKECFSNHCTDMLDHNAILYISVMKISFFFAPTRITYCIYFKLIVDQVHMREPCDREGDVLVPELVRYGEGHR